VKDILYNWGWSVNPFEPVTIVLDLAKPEFIGAIPAPNGFLPSVPDPVGFSLLYSAGDQNQDGYDDIFWTSQWGSPPLVWDYWGLIDGATWTQVWSGFGEGGIYPPGGLGILDPGGMPDVDGDGFRDFPILSNQLTPGIGNGANAYSLQMLSGQTGAVLWNRQETVGNKFKFVLGGDADQDGYPEMIVQEYDGVSSYSAKDGSRLWRTNLGYISTMVPPGEVLSNLTGTAWINADAIPSHPSGFVAIEVSTSDADGFPPLLHSQIAILLDSETGVPFDYLETPPTFAPWNVNGYVSTEDDGFLGSEMTPIGDIDRDGFVEVVRFSKDRERSPAWAPLTSTQVVIFGVQTLFVEPTRDTVNDHSPYQIQIEIPSCAGRDFVVLMSTAFDSLGGLALDGGSWKTHLAPSPLLDWTRSLRILAGTLDSEGKGLVGLMLPASPNFIGTTIYSSAVILETPGAAEQVWTLSTVGVTEMQ